MGEEPQTKKVRAIDVRPYEWAVWGTVAGSGPFANEIESRKWSDDGQSIWFMLGTHNFLEAKPDEELELVPVTDRYATPVSDAQQDAFVRSRPVPTKPCAACNGTGRTPESP